MNNRHGQAGFTIVELLAGLLIFVLITIVLLSHVSVNYSASRAQKDKVFAFTKAQAILAEVQSFVDRGEIDAAVDLDMLDDGPTLNPVLSIATQAGVPIAADSPLSGNHRRSGAWEWSRRIIVKPFTGLNNRNVRYVTVTIYRKDLAGVDRVLASLSSVVTSVGSTFPTTQVFDLYLLAIENIPGWWVFMEAIIPFVESAISDLEGRNPGLSFRTHWITKASYGRNPLYRPYVNENVDSHQPVRNVYYYPGRMPAGNNSTYYYVPSLMRARILYDTGERGGYDLNTNPLPYALADFYNHAMRHPQEKALHDLRVAAVRQREQEIEDARRLGTPEPAPLYDMSSEPTLRLFLEDLATDPAKYANAMIINLHGELIPMPSLRNYSDAAKDARSLGTGGMPNVRVVTHPEELRTRNDPAAGLRDDVVLRVYAYTTNPSTYTGADRTPDTRPIAIRVMGVNLTDPLQVTQLVAGAQIRHMPGGVSAGGSTTYTGFTASPVIDPGSGQMWYQASFVAAPVGGGEPYTLIKLHRTPVRAPADAGSRGVLNTQRSRLYNLEYIPSPPGPTADFSRNLAVAGDLPKNTARWTIRIPGSVLLTNRFYQFNGSSWQQVTPTGDVRLTVRTHLWDPSVTGDTDTNIRSGTSWPTPYVPENVSETYTWWGNNREDVPFSERAQFQGDPRHCPYKDLARADLDYPSGYNWYHDSLNNGGQNAAADFAGFLDAAVLRNRWQSAMRQDVPRFFELLRTGLVRAKTVYTTLTGWSYYYMGHGNEIGYDSANGYPNSIPTNHGPFFEGTTATTGFVNNITGYRRFVINGASPFWWGMTWLGELCPDNVYETQWTALSGGMIRGNLDVADPSLNANTFKRWRDQDAYTASVYRAFGTSLLAGMQRTAGNGCMTFMNHEVAGGRFRHQGSAGTGALVGSGLEMATNYNFPLPSTAPINRPFTFANTTAPAEEWSYQPYVGNRFTGTRIRQYYNHPTVGYEGAGLVELRDTANTSAGYIVVTGISNAVVSGSSFIAKFSILAVVQSFLEGGSTSLTHRIKMPPRVELQFPTDADEIDNNAALNVQWDIFWRRWDGQKYTTGTPPGFSENDAEIEYVLMYSTDQGRTWSHCADDSAAMPGRKPTDPTVIFADANPGGAETFSWDVTSMPEGSYQLLIEAYRAGQQLHYSQHRMRIYLED
jgi:type II secretory pathway pseudopilin PulG